MYGPTAPFSSRAHFASLRLSSLVALFLLLLLAPAAQAQEVSVGGARSPFSLEPAEAKDMSVAAKVARGEAPLSRRYDFIRVESSALHRLPPLDPSEKLWEGPDKKRRIGAVRTLSHPLAPYSDSTSYGVAEGELRLMGVISEGALSTRVRFERMALPDGARLYVYSMADPEEVYGPYEGRGPSGDGNFWTPPMKGDGVAVEYFVPPTAGGTSETPFELTGVSHNYADFQAEELGPAGSCNLEVTSAYANAAKAVGHLRFTLSDGEYICTGTLLNTRSGSFIPYLITANHCFSTQSAAQSLRVYWNYNTGDNPPPGTPFTDGSNLLATNPSSDFTFVRLTGAVPGGLWFTGWTTTMPAVGDPVTGIHHPNGSHKRISFGGRGSQSGCPVLPGPCENFLKVTWNSGTTEGGSSGSELLIGSSADPLYVGNLLGGLASCANPAGADWYGAFNITYASISAFLEDATGTGAETAGLYNPSNSFFFLRNGNSAGSAELVFPYGPAGAGWTPVVGDWNGDGFDTVGLFNPSTSTFFLRNANSAGSAELVFTYGPAGAGWIAVVGDWDGDGVDTVGLFNPSTATFFLRNSNSAGAAALVFQYGPAGAGWIPIVGDWDGDGDDTVGLYNPNNGAWFLRNGNSAGPADLSFFYGPGSSGWRPLAGDWNNDGMDTVGAFNPSSSFFFLRNSNSTGSANLVFSFGPAGAGWTPIVGDWNGM